MTPYLSVQAFTQTPDVHTVFERALRDRRLARVTSEAHPGGMRAALARFEQAQSPDVLVLEADRAALADLPALASVCDPRTKVIIVGHVNDVVLYRELINLGVSEYLVAPVDGAELATAIERIASDGEMRSKSRVYAFMGANGGVGSSTIAQNVAWAMANKVGAGIMLADLDLTFGCADLNFNVETGTQFFDALKAETKVDDALLERLLVKRGQNLHVLTHPALLDREPEHLVRQLVEMLKLARANFNHIVLDLPNHWSALVQDAVLDADEVIVTVTPDLCSLRNGKALLERLGRLRPNDAPPKLVLNQCRMPKRAEIKVKEFSQALNIQPVATIAFDAGRFSTAASTGQMLSEINPKGAAVASCAQIADRLVDPTSQRSKGTTWARFWNFRPRKLA